MLSFLQIQCGLYVCFTEDCGTGNTTSPLNPSNNIHAIIKVLILYIKITPPPICMCVLLKTVGTQQVQ